MKKTPVMTDVFLSTYFSTTFEIVRLFLPEKKGPSGLNGSARRTASLQIPDTFYRAPLKTYCASRLLRWVVLEILTYSVYAPV
ncbi:MAG: hypothetical protein JW764_10050, partial [Chlorobiaceae bacterium]|nr:hypothetical protein [Chlorobiaceae bacterium]